MDRPEWCPITAWHEAVGVADVLNPKTVVHDLVTERAAIALLKVREEAFEEAAKIAETHRPTMSLWLGSEWSVVKLAYEFATKNIASAIRLHSQKGEK